MAQKGYVEKLRGELSDNLEKKYPNKTTGKINIKESTREINAKTIVALEELEIISSNIKESKPDKRRILEIYLTQIDDDSPKPILEISSNTLKNFLNGVEPEIENKHLYSLYLGYVGWYHFEDVVDGKRSNNFYKKAEKENTEDFDLLKQRQKSNEISKKYSVFFNKELLNKAILSYENDYKNQGLEETWKIVDKIFGEIIQSVKLSPLLQREISLFFNPPDSELNFKWYHRVVLASALSLSVLNGWDKNKVNFLRELLNYDHEPMIVDRSLIGITLLLVISHKNEKIFDFTVNKFNIIKDNIRLKSGIYSSLRFFSEYFRSYKTEYSREEFLKFYSIEKDYQHFEPPNQEVSYYKIEKSRFIDEDDENFFFETLNKCSFLTFFIKKRVLVGLNLWDDKEFNDFTLKFLGDAKNEKYQKENRPRSYFIFSQMYWLYDFTDQIKGNENFKKFEKKIISLFRRPDYFIKDIFDKFPYFAYGNILDYSLVEKNVDKTNFQELEGFCKILMLKSIDDQSLAFQKNLFTELNTFFDLSNTYNGGESSPHCFLGSFFLQSWDMDKNDKFISSAVYNFELSIQKDEKNKPKHIFISELLIEWGTETGNSKILRKAIYELKKSRDSQEDIIHKWWYGKCLMKIGEINKNQLYLQIAISCFIEAKKQGVGKKEANLAIYICEQHIKKIGNVNKKQNIIDTELFLIVTE